MRSAFLVVSTLILAVPHLVHAQVGGNVGFAQAGGKARAEQNERARRVLTEHELPPTGTSTFVEANVLMNVKADQYVAVFAVARDGKDAAECGRAMDGAIKEFSDALKQIGIAGDDLFVDFIAQNKIYGYEVTGDVARETLVGIELKKNVSIRYKDRDQIDRLVATAARSQIFDLIKVDYIVADDAAVREKLMEEAARVIKRKIERYDKLLGIKLLPPAQVYAERSATYFPSQMYDSYVAQETEEVVPAAVRGKHTVQTARKGRTFYYNGLDADGFDSVVNPVVLEPAVQFTLYLKLKYEVEQIKAK